MLAQGRQPQVHSARSPPTTLDDWPPPQPCHDTISSNFAHFFRQRTHTKRHTTFSQRRTTRNRIASPQRHTETVTRWQLCGGGVKERKKNERSFVSKLGKRLLHVSLIGPIFRCPLCLPNLRHKKPVQCFLLTFPIGQADPSLCHCVSDFRNS